MGLADELQKLQELHDSGALTEEEFGKAKAALLNKTPPEPKAPRAVFTSEEALDQVARTKSNFQVMTIVVGLVIAVFFFFAFFLPNWREADRRSQEFDRSIQDQRDKFEQERKNQPDEIRKNPGS